MVVARSICLAKVQFLLNIRLRYEEVGLVLLLSSVFPSPIMGHSPLSHLLVFYQFRLF
mgnify:CR=1 FL=1